MCQTLPSDWFLFPSLTHWRKEKSILSCKTWWLIGWVRRRRGRRALISHTLAKGPLSQSSPLTTLLCLTCDGLWPLEPPFDQLCPTSFSQGLPGKSLHMPQHKLCSLLPHQTSSFPAATYSPRPYRQCTSPGSTPTELWNVALVFFCNNFPLWQ